MRPYFRAHIFYNRATLKIFRLYICTHRASGAGLYR